MYHEYSRKQLSTNYDFSLFMKLHRSLEGYLLKEVVDDFNLDISKYSRIENGKIPRDKKFEEQFLTYFNIDIKMFVESEEFYMTTYHEMMNKIVLMSYSDLSDYSIRKIEEYKKINSIHNPLEQFILCICCYVRNMGNEKIDTNKKYCHFVEKNISYFAPYLAKYFYVFKAFLFKNEITKQELYDLLCDIYKLYPSDSYYDCLFYSIFLSFNDLNIDEKTMADYYNKGIKLCFEAGALRRIVYLGMNYSCYLRNIKNNKRALEIDQYNLKILQQLVHNNELLSILDHRYILI